MAFPARTFDRAINNSIKAVTMRTLVVGDIHGKLELFNLLLEKMEYRAGEDRLILIGDLVDRGPKIPHMEFAGGARGKAACGRHGSTLCGTGRCAGTTQEPLSYR